MNSPNGSPAAPAASLSPGSAPAPAKGSWRLLLTHIRPRKWTLVGGGLLGFVGGMSGLAEPLVAKSVIDAFGSGASLVAPIVTLTVLVLFGAAVSAAAAYILERTAESIVLDARLRLVGRMLRLRVPDVDRLKPGDLISRVTADTTLLRAVCTSGVTNGITALFMLAGCLALMAVMDAVLLGVTLGVLVVVGATALFVFPRIGRATTQAQEALGEMGAVLDRALQAFRTVKAAGAEARETEAVRGAANRAWRKGVTAAGWSAIAGTSTWLGVQLSFLAVLGVGGVRVASGTLEVSSLIAFLLYLFYLTGPIAMLVEGATQLQTGLAAVTRMREVEELDVEPLDDPAPRTGSAPAALALADVRFGYDADRSPALDGVSFEIAAGHMTALVGPSGAGKSTIFALLERFYEPTSGTITLDGADLRDIPLSELRAMIGYVEQDTPVLAGSLRENLVFGAPGVTDEELDEVVARTQLADLVARLPEGLATQVGHRGLMLSGGERQRVAIARALLRRPRVLLLDEATSQLDAVNELRLRDVIEEVSGSTTVLVIAHRLSTVTRAERIVVLEAGRVRASGTHAELVHGDELYRELATTQFVVGEEAMAAEGAE
ncbi:ABC transporter ATP-binding protein [Spongiactinospora sp. TRM90649]|uniref:ABC transporter ATP-binding protein n=1 Tax=Spongiactinospora sp. TRM90649 TaxID=3031114 RepID=UPI0023F7C536|nr:ABC transporter ATP-binding protein [Spongiactinospora sp. TRM90649]MDF5752664.1 ABC transporter ATP-binding protein [Spongiactinospora sp. TRM90649]